MPVFDIPTRWGDMDAQSHINNATFVEYLQEARTELLLSGPNAAMLGGGVVVAGHRVEYLRPVNHGERVRARVVVDALGAARFSLAYELVVGDGDVADAPVAVRARTVLVPFDLEADRIRRLTPDERAHFASLQESAEPMRDLPKVVAAAHDAHVQPIRVRWGDLDSYGHVNNVRAYDYVQEARIAMMDAVDPDGGVRSADHLWLVVRQDVDYLAQLRFRREPYAARTVVAKVGTTSLTLACDVVDEDTGEVFHRARTVLVCADRDGRPTRVPDAFATHAARWTV
ncbi:acyl-CoA thioesterase [Mariniluteicoccus flavus]